MEPSLRKNVFQTSATGRRRFSMDKEHMKGAADKAKGAIKDATGKIIGDSKMQAEGKFDKAKGAAHEALGDAKDAAKRASNDD
jgi:uncharacterized protein YjbJ (UPF0337 family)